jgi:hypothetical protein
MATGNSRTCQEGVSFTMVNGVSSTIIGLRVVGFIQPFSMKKSEWWFSIYTAHITGSSN